MAATALAVTLSAWAPMASAGDSAARSVLGFSPDGRHFAFEQFGAFYEDEGGFAELHVIDTTTDSFAPGAPSRAMTRKDGSELTAMLDGQRVRARAPFVDFIRAKRLRIQGTRFEGNPSAPLDDPGIYQLFSQPMAQAMALEAAEGALWRLDLEPVPLGTAKCDGAGGRGVAGEVPVAGFALKLMLGGESLVLHADAKLPQARRCAGAYGLAEAFLHKAKDGERTLAVLVEFTDFNGFHAGPNRRFMAVTKRLGRE